LYQADKVNFTFREGGYYSKTGLKFFVYKLRKNICIPYALSKLEFLAQPVHTPKHKAPQFIVKTFAIALDKLDEYPVHAFFLAEVDLSLNLLVHKNVCRKP